MCAEAGIADWLLGECKAFRSCSGVWSRKMRVLGRHGDGMGVSACAERRCWIGCMVSVVGYKARMLVSGWLQSVSLMFLRVVMEDVWIVERWEEMGWDGGFSMCRADLLERLMVLVVETWIVCH